jgi:hypothetical protein
MRKLSYRLSDDLIEGAPRRSRWPRVFLVVLLVAGLGPLALEGAAISIGHWKQVLGVSADVRTPTLDRVGESLQDLSDTLWSQVTPIFSSLPWEPKVIVPATVIVMGLAMMLLRR